MANMTVQNMEHIISEAQQDFAACETIQDLEQAKARYLGKSGLLTEQLKGLGKLSAEERPAAGAAINVVKQGVEEALRDRREAILGAEQAKQLASESIDVTMPARNNGKGGLHPVTMTLNRLEQIFHSIGFAVAEGPEIETDFYNFTALNIPEDHPRVRCTILSTSTTSTCCARIPHRCRCIICRTH
jgi:phenylalanyl-tRNA synthetase alpha chain